MCWEFGLIILQQLRLVRSCWEIETPRSWMLSKSYVQNGREEREMTSLRNPDHTWHAHIRGTSRWFWPRVTSTVFTPPIFSFIFVSTSLFRCSCSTTLNKTSISSKLRFCVSGKNHEKMVATMFNVPNIYITFQVSIQSQSRARDLFSPSRSSIQCLKLLLGRFLRRRSSSAIPSWYRLPFRSLVAAWGISRPCRPIQVDPKRVNMLQRRGR